MKKRLLAILLTLTMVLTYMPAIAFADGETEAGQDNSVSSELNEEAPEKEETEDLDSSETMEDASEEASEDAEAATEDNEPIETLENAEGKAPLAVKEDVGLTKVDFETKHEYGGYAGTTILREDEIGMPGDRVTLTYSDGSSEVYEYIISDAGAFILVEPDGEDGDIDVDWKFADANQDVFRDGNNAVRIIVNGVASDNTFNVKGIPSPTTIKYTPGESLKAYAGTSRLVPPELESVGSSVVITYTDGNSKKYIFDDASENFIYNNDEEDTIDVDWEFVDEGTEEFSGDTATIKIYLMGDYSSAVYDTAVVTVIPKPAKVTSAVFTPAETSEYSAIQNGTYPISLPSSGDRFIVSFDDGTTETFTYVEGSEGNEGYFTDSKGNPLDEEKYLYEWRLKEGNHTITKENNVIEVVFYDDLSFYLDEDARERDDFAFVTDVVIDTIEDGGIKSVRFIDPQKITLVDGAWKSDGKDGYWYVFTYEDPIFEGDRVAVKFADDETDTEYIYTAKVNSDDEEGVPDLYFENTEVGDEFPSRLDYTTYDDQSASSPWTAGTHNVTFNFEGAVATRPVTVPKPPARHDLEHHEAVDPTCEEKGNIEYWYCNTCEKYFEDEEESEELTEEDVFIDPLGHEWGETTYIPSEDYTEVTATRICNRAPGHIESETADITSTTTGTCGEVSTITYSAEFENTDFSWSEVKEGAVVPHNWEVTYTWADDNSYVIATRTCSNCTAEETETAFTTITTTEPKCGVNSVTTYTATFKDEEFETQTKKVENDDAPDHVWSGVSYTWADDNSTVTANRICNRCQHEETETATAAKTVESEPTCTTPGSAKFSATFENTAFAPQETEAVLPIDENAHDWGKATYVWAEDYSECTARRECVYNSEHVETETATDITKETKAPTCTNSGSNTYTATFKNSAFETQSKNEELPVDPDAHSWEYKEISWTEDAENGYTAAAVYVCKDNHAHTKSVNAEVSKETVESTCKTAGKTTYTAAVAEENSLDGQKHEDKKEVALPLAAHKLSKVDEVPATCTETGTEAYYKCSVCEKLFSDAEGTDEISAPVVIDKLPHNLSKVNEVPATCTETGTEAYYKCSACDKLFSDEAGTKEISAPVVIDKLPHSMEAVAEVPATYTTEGTKEYHKCTSCQKLFSDAAGTQEIEAPEVIPTLENQVKAAEEAAQNAKTDAEKAAKAAETAAKNAAEAATKAQNAANGAASTANASTADTANTEAQKAAKAAETAAKNAAEAATKAQEAADEAQRIADGLTDEAEKAAAQNIADNAKAAADDAKTAADAAKADAGNAATSATSAQTAANTAKSKKAAADKAALANKEIQDLPAVKIKSAKRYRKAFTARWKKVSKKNRKKIGGIEIQYSTNRQFTANVKTVTAKKTKSTKRISKLPRKKVYYVRVRAYKWVGNVKHVSKWSSVRKTKTR